MFLLKGNKIWKSVTIDSVLYSVLLLKINRINAMTDRIVSSIRETQPLHGIYVDGCQIPERYFS